MLYCGDESNNSLVETALGYLPDDISNQIDGRVAITVLSGDACRLGHKICAYEEIIILSPWIFGYIPAGSCEVDKEFKYLIFCVLHEIAHAILKHYPPYKLSAKQNEEQEVEADKYAIKWFNEHVKNSNIELTRISIEEIREIQQEYQKRRESFLVTKNNNE